MKKIRQGTQAIFTFLIMILILAGCQSNPDKAKIDVGRIENDHGFGWAVFTIDSCEYIRFVDYYDNRITFLHKHNCKYCQKRNDAYNGNKVKY